MSAPVTHFREMVYDEKGEGLRCDIDFDGWIPPQDPMILEPTVKLGDGSEFTLPAEEHDVEFYLQSGMDAPAYRNIPSKETQDEWLETGWFEVLPTAYWPNENGLEAEVGDTLFFKAPEPPVTSPVTHFREMVFDEKGEGLRCDIDLDGSTTPLDPMILQPKVMLGDGSEFTLTAEEHDVDWRYLDGVLENPPVYRSLPSRETQDEWLETGWFEVLPTAFWPNQSDLKAEVGDTIFVEAPEPPPEPEPEPEPESTLSVSLEGPTSASPGGTESFKTKIVGIGEIPAGTVVLKGPSNEIGREEIEAVVGAEGEELTRTVIFSVDVPTATKTRNGETVEVTTEFYTSENVTPISDSIIVTVFNSDSEIVVDGRIRDYVRLQSDAASFPEISDEEVDIIIAVNSILDEFGATRTNVNRSISQVIDLKVTRAVAQVDSQVGGSDSFEASQLVQHLRLQASLWRRRLT